MLRMRNDDNIKPELRGKQIEIVYEDATLCLVKLLEDAGSQKTGDQLSAFRSQIEEYDEASGTTRFYDPSFADTLDDKLNRPYEPENMPCPRDNCDNDSGFNYAMTGYIISDEQGMYVEKKCERCCTVTTDGDGDFHTYFRVENGDILNNIERHTAGIDPILFMHFDNEDTALLEDELYKLVDNYAKQFRPNITCKERDSVVQLTLKSIDDETQSIDACLCNQLSGLDD